MAFEPTDTVSGAADDVLQFELSNAGGEPVRLAVTGELDRCSTEQLRRAVAEIVRDSPPETLQVDASGIGFLDSSGIRCLLMCRADARAAGVRVVLVDPSPCVRQVLEITGLLETFDLPLPATPTLWRRGTPPRASGRSHGPVPMQELLAQSAALRQDAQETRRRAAAVRGDDLLRRTRLGLPQGSTNS